MDSRANTASIQSSSANDDFHSSTAQSISSFFNPTSPHPPSNFPPPHPHRPNPNHFFHHSSSLFTFRPPIPNPNHLNFPNFTHLNPSPSPSPPSTFFPIQSSPSAPPPPQSISDKPPSSDTIVKNPKKRTRASRRAPTTLLTTDTTNFRQMVQEFTGIPSSPFSPASPYTRRLDLFSSPSSSGLRQFDTLGPLYSLRPQFHPPPPPNPNLNSTMIDSIVASTSMINPNSINNSTDHMLSLQNSLQLGGSFGNGREEDDDDDDGNDDENLRRWKSGETVRRRRNNNGDGDGDGDDDDDDDDEENVETRTAYDHHGNIDNIRSHHNHNHQQQQHQQQHQISEMNLKNLAEKGTIGSANGGGGGGGGSSSSGTVAPWIFPTQ